MYYLTLDLETAAAIAARRDVGLAVAQENAALRLYSKLSREEARLRAAQTAAQVAHDAKKKEAGITRMTAADLSIKCQLAWADELARKARAALLLAADWHMVQLAIAELAAEQVAA